MKRETWLNGRRVGYLKAGSGPTMLLLHGVGESSASWREVLPRLADRHTVYAPDLPGYGSSDPLASTEGGPTPERFAALMAAFLNTVTNAEADPAVVVGHSLGGSIALELALRHPQQVERLILEDAAGLGRYVNPALRSLTLSGYGDLGVRMGSTRLGSAHRALARIPLMFARPHRAPLDWVVEQCRLATLPHHLPTTLSALRAQVGPFGQRRVLLDELPQLQIPTLLVWGAQDAVLPVSQAHTAVARLRHGQLAVVPSCGHLPHLEQPDRFLDALRAFLLA